MTTEGFELGSSFTQEVVWPTEATNFTIISKLIRNITEVAKEAYLFTMDVECFCTNIPNKERIAAVKRVLDNYLTKLLTSK